MTSRSKILRSFGTHDGSFHADEVTACALLLLCCLIDRDKIVRTRDPLMLIQCEYVCDVGGAYLPQEKLFDHHQQEYRGELSSAGMILTYLKEHQFLSKEEFDLFYNSLVKGVDAHDNGLDLGTGGVCSFSHLIANFAPIAYSVSDKEQQAAFFQAVDFAYSHLKRMLERFNYTHSCRQLVADCMALYKECLIFDHALPWMDNFFALGGEKHPALFVIMPSSKHWKLRAIPPTATERMKVRVPLPEKWAGLLDEELKEISGINGAIFCHKGRFISVWETREDALKALDYVLK